MEQLHGSFFKKTDEIYFLKMGIAQYSMNSAQCCTPGLGHKGNILENYISKATTI